MPKRVSNVAGAAAALIACAALVHCFDSGPGNTSFTHPYMGPNGSNSSTASPDPSGTSSPSPGDGTTPMTPGATDLLTGAATGTGSATFSGSIKSVTFTPTVALFDAQGSDANTPLALMVVLSDNANFCSDVVGQGNLPASSNYALMRMTALDANMTATALAAGDYSVVASGALTTQQAAGNYASFDFFALDNLCLQSLADSYYHASSGHIALTALSANPNSPAASGSASLFVGAQNDAVAAMFAAAPCPGLHALVDDPNSLGCH